MYLQRGCIPMFLWLLLCARVYVCVCVCACVCVHMLLFVLVFQEAFWERLWLTVSQGLVLIDKHMLTYSHTTFIHQHYKHRVGALSIKSKRKAISHTWQLKFTIIGLSSWKPGNLFFSAPLSLSLSLHGKLRHGQCTAGAFRGLDSYCSYSKTFVSRVLGLLSEPRRLYPCPCRCPAKVTLLQNKQSQLSRNKKGWCILSQKKTKKHLKHLNSQAGLLKLAPSLISHLPSPISVAILSVSIACLFDVTSHLHECETTTVVQEVSLGAPEPQATGGWMGLLSNHSRYLWCTGQL